MSEEKKWSPFILLRRRFFICFAASLCSSLTLSVVLVSSPRPLTNFSFKAKYICLKSTK